MLPRVPEVSGSLVLKPDRPWEDEAGDLFGSVLPTENGTVPISRFLFALVLHENGTVPFSTRHRERDCPLFAANERPSPVGSVESGSFEASRSS